jgi:serine protease AprX
VDFGSGATTFQAYLSAAGGSQLELRLDRLDGPLIGRLDVRRTGEAGSYASQSIAIAPTSGMHDLFLVAAGAGAIAGIDHFSFAQAGDQYGHGTLVAGIIAGNGRAAGGSIVGVAPQANLINVRINDENGVATAADVIAGLQWINDNRDTYNIRVVNISLNSSVPESYHTSALAAAAEILWFNGIVVVASAGNNGADGRLYAPANDPFVITVGAADDRGTAERGDDTLAAFSARGTDESGQAKPELVAPGVNIVSTRCATCTLSRIFPGNAAAGFSGAQEYFRASGTSLAAPVVAGVAALMLQKEPELTPDQVKQRLIMSGTAIEGSQSSRYLDAAAALASRETASANQKVEISAALSTGSEAITEGSGRWGSGRWGSGRWGSGRWGSVDWNSDAMNESSSATVSNVASTGVILDGTTYTYTQYLPALSR